MKKNICAFIFAFVFFCNITIPAFSNDTGHMSLPSIEEVALCFEQLEHKLFKEQDVFFLSYTRVVGDNLVDKKKLPQVRYLNGRLGDTWMTESFLTTKNKDDGSRKIQYFARKNLIWEWRESSSHGVVVPFENGRNFYQNWHYFHYFGVPPYRMIAESNGASFSRLMDLARTEATLFPLNNELLPDCLKNHLDKYHIRTAQEEVEGQACWVVERPGLDIIWIDPSIENAVRKRITFWETGGPKKSEIINRNFKEILPALFLPFEQEVTQYIGKETGMHESVLGSPLYHFVYSVDDIQIGTITEEDRKKLILDPSVGTSVFDLRTEDHYTITDEGADPFVGPIGQGIKARRFVIVRSLLIICGSVLMFIALWRMLGKKEKENKKAP